VRQQRNWRSFYPQNWRNCGHFIPALTFVVVLLCWWADALLKVLPNQDIQARVNFMDGPYAVDVARSFGMLNFRMIARDREIGTGEAAVKPWHPFPIFTCFGHRHRYGTL
jgi:hypothetical protein